MSDVNEWLKKRRTIHDAATEGRWHKLTRTDEGPAVVTDRSGMLPPDWVAYAGMCSGEDGENARAIVDAHNTLPALLTTIEAALEIADFMASDAETELNAGNERASEVLIQASNDLHHAIEGAIK